MAELTQFFFNHQEVVEELIKKQNIHKGRWKLLLELGLAATNVNVLVANKPVLTPTGMVLIQKIGITQTEETGDLTVDAAQVNPRKSTNASKRPKKR